MASFKSTSRQMSFDFSSPLNAVLSSVTQSVGQQHEKALRMAFYNTAALLFVALSVGAAVAVYFVLEFFLRPLLWAGLCGAFLHPFKTSLSQALCGWLKSLNDSNTPFAVGAVVLPFQMLNKCSDMLGSLIVEKMRVLMFIFVAVPVVYAVIVIEPFVEIWMFLQHVAVLSYQALDCFSNPLWVWTLIVAYMIVLIFWWTPSMSKVLPYFSIPVWIALLMHLASIAGAFGLPLFLVVMMLCFVGLVAELAENKKHDTVDGIEAKGKRRSLIASISVAAAALGSIPVDESSDSSPEDSKKGPNVTAAKPGTGVDTADGAQLTRLQRMRQLQQVKMKVKKSKTGSASRKFFVALFWGILLCRLWIHMWVFQLLPIPIGIYLVKKLMSRSGAWDFLQGWFWHMFAQLRDWVFVRQDALAPAPIRGLGKLTIQGDKKVNSFIEQSMDKILSVVIVMTVIIGSILLTVLLAVQVHHESSHLVGVGGNLVNDIISSNPNFFQWITENKEIQQTMKSTADRLYLHGRGWIASKVHMILGAENENSTQLKQSVLELTDRFYHAWVGPKDNTSTSSTKPCNGSITAAKQSPMASNISWWNMLSWFKNETTQFQFSLLFSVIKENLGFLMSLLDSLWIILKGNINLAFNLVTMILSLVVFSGTYVLNAGLSMVVFITTLFYLLSSSGDEYRPVQWFGKLTASGSVGFGEALNTAIRDVFGASLKMAAFYGLYTWFTHTVFGINIVFIPSAVAAIAAVMPFIGTYWAAVPAVLELWLVHGEEVQAALLAFLHLLPTYFVDIAIYSEISGGGHPYLTGLAVAGGMYCIGLEGAIVGPIVLCCLIVAFNVYGNMLGNNSPTVSDANLVAVDGLHTGAKIQDIDPAYKKTPVTKRRQDTL